MCRNKETNKDEIRIIHLQHNVPCLLSLCNTVQLSQLTVRGGKIIDLLYMYCSTKYKIRSSPDVLFLQPFWQAESWLFFPPAPLMSLDRDGDYITFGWDCDGFGPVNSAASTWPSLIVLYPANRHLTLEAKLVPLKTTN